MPTWVLNHQNHIESVNTMLSIKNLEAGYGKVKVLHGISIDVPKGQVITLIGSNGAGKTTTMRAITGMIKPTGGEVTLGGEKIDGYDSHKIARLGLAHSPEGRRVCFCIIHPCFGPLLWKDILLFSR